MSAGEILLEMIKNGFISLDENSKKHRAAKLIVLNKKKKWLSSSDLSDTERERGRGSHCVQGPLCDELLPHPQSHIEESLF